MKKRLLIVLLGLALLAGIVIKTLPAKDRKGDEQNTPGTR